MIASNEEVIILTARGSAEPVEQFLSDEGLPPIEVIALGNSDPQEKARHIAMRIVRDELIHVSFFDDSHKNVAAVATLANKFPGTKIVSRLVRP
jgi:hypothetical protein